jgi:hypothetical protein
MLDGRAMYGIYETTGTAPTDLDACGGHTGAVPSHTAGGVTYPAAKNVYHYHSQVSTPNTIGCYGPVASMDECKALYPDTCGDASMTLTTRDGVYYNYDLDCPCFKMGNETHNQITLN